MNKINLIAIDIDGTLLNDKGKITNKVFNSIKKVFKKGIYVILCTGRMHKSAEQFNFLFNKEPIIISYNGALIKKNKKTLYCKTLPLKKQEEVFNKILEYNLYPNVYTEDELFTIKKNPFIKEYSERIKVKYKLFNKNEISSFLKNNKIIKISGIGDPKLINKFIEKEYFKYKNKMCFSKSFEYFLEISHKEVNKGNALKIIGEKLNIKTKNMMGIGDNLNDKTMLDLVGFPVLMENGIDSLKNKKYFLTKSNNESGVAYAITQFIN